MDKAQKNNSRSSSQGQKEEQKGNQKLTARRNPVDALYRKQLDLSGLGGDELKAVLLDLICRGCRGGLPTDPVLITPVCTEASAKMFSVSLETDRGLLSQLVKFY